MEDEIVGVTIPDLPNAGALTGSEPFETVQDGISVKTTADGIKKFVGAVTGITSTDGSIDIDLADPSAPDLSIPSGAFTPTISNETDCTAECLRALYSRSGNVVTVSYYLSIGLDPLITSGGFNVSLPIPSTFASPRDAFGVIGPISDPFSLLVAPTISADTVENEISMTIQLSTSGASLTFVANIQYIIL